MARIRTVKPGFFRHEGLQDLEAANPGRHVMLVFAGLWGHCDKAGRFLWQPRQLKLDILPFLNFDMAGTMALLEEAGFVTRYEVAGKQYGTVPTFLEHQRISGKEATEPETHPAPPETRRGSKREATGKRSGPPETAGREGNGVQEEEGTRPASPGAIAPPTPIDLAKHLWDTGVAFLKARSVPERQAREMLGKWRKTNTDAAILAALTRAEATSAVDPIPFLTATLKGKSNGKPREDRDTQRRRRRSEILEGLGAEAPVERGEHSAHGGEPDPRGVACGPAELVALRPETDRHRGGGDRGVGRSVQHAGSGLEGSDGVLSREPGPSAGGPADGSVPGGEGDPQMGNEAPLAERVAGGGERADGRTPAADREAGDCETLPHGDRPSTTHGSGDRPGGRDHAELAQQPGYDRDRELSESITWAQTRA